MTSAPPSPPAPVRTVRVRVVIELDVEVETRLPRPDLAEVLDATAGLLTVCALDDLEHTIRWTEVGQG